MGIRIIEIKDDYLKKDEREFLFKVSTTEQILHYQDLMISKKAILEYTKKKQNILLIC